MVRSKSLAGASPSPCLTSLVSALTTSHSITLSGLYPSQLYSYRILSKDSSNNLAASNQTFTTATPAPAPTPATDACSDACPPPVPGTYSLWSDNVTIATPSDPDPRAIEVGVKFKSDIDGVISAIRFYKGSAEYGNSHRQFVEAARHSSRASVSYGETASGWQQVNLSPPVNISANTTYVASYLTTSGHYSFNSGYFIFSVQQRASARFGRYGHLRRQRLVANQRDAGFSRRKIISPATSGWTLSSATRSALRLRRDTTAPVVSGISVTNITSSGAHDQLDDERTGGWSSRVHLPMSFDRLSDRHSVHFGHFSHDCRRQSQRSDDLCLPHPIQRCGRQSRHRRLGPNDVDAGLASSGSSSFSFKPCRRLQRRHQSHAELVGGAHSDFLLPESQRSQPRRIDPL